MDKQKNRKAYSFSNNSKIEGLKNKKELRLRLIKLTNNYFKPRCEHFINNIRSFNIKIMEFSGGRKSIEKEIKENKNFRFGKKRDYFVHLTDLSPYKINVVPFLKNLKNNFTNEELDIIKKDKEYYLTNELLKENISAFNVPPLYQIINKEEEDENKKQRVFHDLNYFNKRRRESVMNMNNLLQKKISIINIKDDTIEPKNKKIYKFENTNSQLNNEKINYENIIAKEIREGVKQVNEENKKMMKTKNLILDFEKESTNEVNKFFKDKKELDLQNKLKMILKTDKKNKNKKFPIIRNESFTKNNKINTDNNLDKDKRKSYLKEKKPDLTKKIIDYEQRIIRDVNRRIKNIYEKLNRPNNSND